MENLSIKLIAPSKVWFSLTGLCNNECQWCYRGGSEIKEFLDTDFIFLRQKLFQASALKEMHYYREENQPFTKTLA